MCTVCDSYTVWWVVACMKAKDQVSFYDAIESMDLKDLEKILGILLKKEMTKDAEEKIRMVDIAIKYKQKRREYFKKL